MNIKFSSLNTQLPSRVEAQNMPLALPEILIGGWGRTEPWRWRFSVT